jgi:hypothetical protein
MITFVWAKLPKVTWVMRTSPYGPVYRDNAHLGGRWSDAVATIKNPSIARGFKKCLIQAIEDLSTVPA